MREICSDQLCFFSLYKSSIYLVENFNLVEKFTVTNFSTKSVLHCIYLIGGSGPKVSIVTPEDTFSPDRRQQQQQQQPSTKSRNKPQKAKKRKGFGFGSGGGEDGEQEVFQCELCNVTVNSQQQLDMHLTGKIMADFSIV